MAINSYSVIIPTYNRRDLLKDAVSSLETQTVKPAEVIIVDDGSTDGTFEFCKGLLAAKARSLNIAYHRTENSGVSAARNLGASHASSDCLAFLDSDDVWLPHMGEFLLKALLSRPESGWGFSNFIQTQPDLKPLPGLTGFKHGFPAFASTNVDPLELFGAHLRSVEIEANENRFHGYYGDFFPLLFLGNFVQPSGAMIRRTAFFEAGGFDRTIRCAEETEFFHRLSAKQPGIVLLPRSYLWRMGSPNSLSSSNTIALIEGAFRSHARARKLRALNPTGEEMSRRGFSLLYDTYLLSLITRGQNRSARGFIVRSIVRDRYFTMKTPLFFLASLIPSKFVLRARQMKRTLRNRFSA
jgi:glycosyltransferase involved in cell wall biosynthesis